jgi:hypothetical protein
VDLNRTITMPATATDSLIFRHIFSTEAMRRLFADETRVQYYLDIEAALARVQARLGIIPHEAAEEIGRHCRADAPPRCGELTGCATSGHRIRSKAHSVLRRKDVFLRLFAEACWVPLLCLRSAGKFAFRSRIRSHTQRTAQEVNHVEVRTGPRPEGNWIFSTAGESARQLRNPLRRILETQKPCKPAVNRV